MNNHINAMTCITKTNKLLYNYVYSLILVVGNIINVVDVGMDPSDPNLTRT